MTATVHPICICGHDKEDHHYGEGWCLSSIRDPRTNKWVPADKCTQFTANTALMYTTDGM